MLPSSGNSKVRVISLCPAGMLRVRSLAGSLEKLVVPVGRMPAPRDTCCALGLYTVYERVMELPGSATAGLTSTEINDGVAVAVGVDVSAPAGCSGARELSVRFEVGRGLRLVLRFRPSLGLAASTLAADNPSATNSAINRNA